MDDVLKPCPFCGGARIRSHYIRDGRSIGCADCGGSLRAYNGPTDITARLVSAWNRRVAAPADDRVREPLIDVMASLAAAISLLERSPKTVAASDKMFDMMLDDYRGSLERARAFFNGGTDA